MKIPNGDVLQRKQQAALNTQQIHTFIVLSQLHLVCVFFIIIISVFAATFLLIYLFWIAAARLCCCIYFISLYVFLNLHRFWIRSLFLQTEVCRAAAERLHLSATTYATEQKIFFYYSQYHTLPIIIQLDQIYKMFENSHNPSPVINSYRPVTSSNCWLSPENQKYSAQLYSKVKTCLRRSNQQISGILI